MTTYAVWRRHPDGHTGSTVGPSLPRGWKYRRDGETIEVTFELLLETDDWPEAHDRVAAERATRPTDG